MFDFSDSDPHGVSHVKFDDLNPEAVEVLLNYAYTAQLKADKELVKDVYSAAKKAENGSSKAGLW